MPHCVRVALAKLLLSGVTTLADLSMAYPCWLDLLAEARMRVCIASMFRSASWYTKTAHLVEYEWNEAAGEKAMADALPLILRAEQYPSDRLFGMAAPAQVDTRGEIIRRHGHTPIGWLHHLGPLSERSIIGHGIFLDDHPSTLWHTKRDLALLAETGTTAADCPVVLAGLGIMLKDFGRYMRAGVNLGVGNGTYPHDMLDEPQLVSYLARAQANVSCTPNRTDLFKAVTVARARALGRGDIGRLAPDCSADLLLVDMTHPMMRLTHDPVRSLVHAAGDHAVHTVFVGGHKVVEEGRVLTTDYPAAAEALHEAGARAKAAVQNVEWARRLAGTNAPLTFPPG